MFKRMIVIEGRPHIQFEFSYDSRSNALKGPEWDKERMSFSIEDDYGHRLVLTEKAVILADYVSDMGEEFRAQGEVEVCKSHAERKFNDRVEKDAVLKSFRTKKAIEQQMRNAPRVAMPPGMPNA